MRAAPAFLADVSRVGPELSHKARSPQLADERDLMAAMLNAKGKGDQKDDEKSDAQSANYTDAYDAEDRQGVMGPDNGPQHRAGPGEGIRAPFASDSGGPPQTSVFDGKGNESVVVAGPDEGGRLAQGSGPDVESAQGDVSDDTGAGSDFGNPEKD